jgi:hypothetical protein
LRARARRRPRRRRGAIHGASRNCRYKVSFAAGAGLWIRMQGAYDAWHAERSEDVSRIPTIKAKAA